jgi:hypothetical protein
VSGSKKAFQDWLIQEDKMADTKTYILIALAALLNAAREAGVTDDEITQLLNADPVVDGITISDDPEEASFVDAAPYGEPDPMLSNEPTVTKVGVESAHFSNGITILRQRPYLNINFAGLRNAHDILQSDTFRSVFQVGRTLSETQRLFANPEDIQVDGDPGDARSRVLKP